MSVPPRAAHGDVQARCGLRRARGAGERRLRAVVQGRRDERRAQVAHRLGRARRGDGGRARVRQAGRRDAGAGGAELEPAAWLLVVHAAGRASRSGGGHRGRRDAPRRGDRRARSRFGGEQRRSHPRHLARARRQAGARRSRHRALGRAARRVGACGPGLPARAHAGGERRLDALRPRPVSPARPRICASRT